MNSKFEKIFRGSVFGALLVLFVSLPGCPVAEDDLTAGSAYEVEIQVLEGGTLYAVEIEASDEGDGEDGEDDGEDGEDGEEDGENEDEDGEEDEDEGGDVEEGFSVQVDSVAADCSSFTVFGSLIVVLDADEDDDENVEQEGEHEGENGEGSFTQLSLDYAVKVPGMETVEDGEGDGEEGEEEIGIGDLAAGMWIEVEGEYEEDGIFEAEEIEIADEEETEIEAVIENLTGTTFTMLGLTITYDSATVIDLGDEDDGEDGEDDDEGCEQEGENEGEDEGC